MLDRYAIQKLLHAKVSARQIAEQFKEFGADHSPDCPRGRGGSGGGCRRSRAERDVGRPGVADAVRTRVAALLAEDRERCHQCEVWRLLRDEGTPVGLSTVYRLVAGVRLTLPTSPMMVRFEGVAGEFAQFDFGIRQCSTP